MLGSFLSSLVAGALRSALDAAPYLLLGFLVAGILHEFLNVRPLLGLLAQGNLKSILAATFLGIPLPLCSCSVLPTAVALRRKGASRAATTAFLVSTPETGADSIALTYGLFGPAMAVVRPVAAVATGIVTALLSLLTPEERDAAIPESPGIPSQEAASFDEHEHDPDETLTSSFDRSSEDTAGEEGPGLKSRFTRALRYGFVTLFDELAFWLTIAFLTSGLLIALLPEDFFRRFLSNELLSLLVMALLSVPLYVCASASTAVAAAMVARGLNPGAALVYMLTGPATNLPTIALVGRLFGRRFVAVYVGCILGCSLAAGFVLDGLAASGLLRPIRASVPTGDVVTSLSFFSLIVFMVLLLRSAWRGSLRRGIRDTIAGVRTGFRFSSDFVRRVRWQALARVAVLAAALVWATTSLVRIGPGERGLLRVLGRFVSPDLAPGLHLVLPAPFSSVERVSLDAVRVIEIGFRNRPIEGTSVRPASYPPVLPAFAPGIAPRIGDESQFVTGDENIIEVTAIVTWRVVDAVAFRLGTDQPETALRALTRSLLVEEIARTQIDALYSTARGDVEARVLSRLGAVLAELRLGVAALEVRLLYVHAPDYVHSAFRDVASASEDKATTQNRAFAESEATVNVARGEAARLASEAQAFRSEVSGRAHGDSDAFTRLAAAHRAAPGITDNRLYLETMERALAPLAKIIKPDSRRAPDFELWMVPAGGGARLPFASQQESAVPPPSASFPSSLLDVAPTPTPPPGRDGE